MKLAAPRFAPSFALGLPVLVCVVLGATPAARAQGDAEVEARFTAMLTDAVLQGTWAPLQQGKLGADKGNDRYRIARAEKKADGRWAIYYVVSVGGKTVEFPIDAVVRFAGDTAVLILDDVRAGPGKANWSARIMFHDDVYAGRWWATANESHGGTVAGTITRTK